MEESNIYTQIINACVYASERGINTDDLMLYISYEAYNELSEIVGKMTKDKVPSWTEFLIASEGVFYELRICGVIMKPAIGGRFALCERQKKTRTGGLK